MNDDLLQFLLDADEEALQSEIARQRLSIQTVRVLKDLSSQYYYDDPAQAVRIAQTAVRLGKLLPAPASALGKWTLANAILFEDRYKEAAELFDRARAEYLDSNERVEAARMGVGQVWALTYTGQIEAALDLANQIEPDLIAVAATDPRGYNRLGGLYNNMGILYDLSGQYQEALAAYDRKLKILQSVGQPQDLARTQHNRAVTLTGLNAYDQALVAFQYAEEVFEPLGAVSDLARLAYNRGTLYALRGQYEQAEAQFGKAEAWLSSLENTQQARAGLTIYRAIARLHSPEPLSLELLTQIAAARHILTTHGPLFEEGLAWLVEGQIAARAGDSERSAAAFQRVLTISEVGGGRPLAWEALYYLGQLARQSSDFELARHFYERAIVEIERIRNDLGVSVFRAGFLHDKLVPYQALSALHLQQNCPDLAFAVLEQSKARLVAEQLCARFNAEVKTLAAIQTAPDHKIAQRLNEALIELDQLHKQAGLDFTNHDFSTWSAAPTPQTLLQVKFLENQITEWSQALEQSPPIFSGYEIPLATISASLDGALLIEYQITEGQIGAFIIDVDGIRTYQKLIDLAQVEQTRQQFATAVERTLGLFARYGMKKLNRYLNSLLADVYVQLGRLYDWLIRPLQAYLNPGQGIVIVPDGPLYYVPFHALFDGAHFLLEDHDLSYAPSASVFSLCKQYSDAGDNILVAGWGGETLPHVEAEIVTLRELLPEADVLQSKDATTGHFMQNAPHYSIIHLAAHARFRADRVMLSSIAFCDRSLTLAEISRLHLKAEMVVLSGCETGRGSLYGNDLIGLASGFLGAGARSLMVSLWRVGDEVTTLQMTKFYQLIKAGVPRSAALQQAQLEILRIGREQPAAYAAYAHPAFWAPFMMIGNRGILL